MYRQCGAAHREQTGLLLLFASLHGSEAGKAGFQSDSLHQQGLSSECFLQTS